MLIASFLKTETGDFDVPALAILVLATFAGGGGLLIMIPKALHERRIRFGSAGLYGLGEYLFERDKDPVKFWMMIVLFFCTYTAMIVVAILISFGVLRQWK